MPRGGYQKPKDPAPVSGPGKFSRRTDGGQKVQASDMDNPDLQYGDRSMLEEAQRATPLKGSQGASVPSGGAQRRSTGEALTGGSLPPWFSQSPDTNPSEPSTAGLASGPGPGPEILDASTPSPDIREQVLEYLAGTFGNEDIRDMLNQMRNERQARMNVPTPSAPMTSPLSALAKEPLPAPVGGALSPTDASASGGDSSSDSE